MKFIISALILAFSTTAFSKNIVLTKHYILDCAASVNGKFLKSKVDVSPEPVVNMALSGSRTAVVRVNSDLVSMQILDLKNVDGAETWIPLASSGIKTSGGETSVLDLNSNGYRINCSLK